MLGSLSPPGYSLIRASLFPRVRAAFCCLLSNSLRHLQGLSSPKFFAATSPQLPAAQGHWFLEDPSYFQLPLANTDAWKEALKKSFVVQGLVSWCSESYLINSSFRPLAPAPVQQAGLLAPVGAQKCPKRPGETTLSLCWACAELHRYVGAGAPPCRNPREKLPVLWTCTPHRLPCLRRGCSWKE